MYILNFSTTILIFQIAVYKQKESQRSTEKYDTCSVYFCAWNYMTIYAYITF